MADRNQNQDEGRGNNASGAWRSNQQNRSGGQGFAAYGRHSSQSGYGSYDPQPGTRVNSSAQRRGQGQQQEDWGTQPYYGGYGYDFKGEGFGGWAQGYPNPGFGSQNQPQSGGGSGQGSQQSASGGRQSGQSGHGPHTGKGPKRSDERIQDDVVQRLTEHGHLDASNVDVQVSDGEVTLSGTVDSRSAKRMAEDVAESVSGVKDVHNRLTIQQGQQGQQSGQQSQQAQTVH